MTTQSTTTKEALEPRLLPCPLLGHAPSKDEWPTGPYIAVSGAPDMPKFYAIVCPNCCSTAYDEDKERVIKKWNSRVSAPIVAPTVDAMWEALKAACCKNPAEAKLAVFVSEKKFKEALAPFAAPIVAPTQELPSDYICIAPQEQALVINRLRGVGSKEDNRQAELHEKLCLRCQELAAVCERREVAPIVAPVVDHDALADRVLQVLNNPGITEATYAKLKSVLAPASTVAPQQSEQSLKKLAARIIDAVVKSPCVVEVRFFSQPEEAAKLENQIAEMLTPLTAPASPAAPSLEKCMAEPKSDTEPICANCEHEIVKSEYGPPINDICWSHVHNGVVWCNWPSPAALRDEAERVDAERQAAAIVTVWRAIKDHDDKLLVRYIKQALLEWKPVAAPTPPPTLAKAAAEEIAANYEVHKDRCHSNERYPLPPCDCGAINEIAAIIERCLSGGGEGVKPD